MPGPVVFDERVGGGEQTLEPRLAGEITRLGDHRELAAVLRLEVQRVFAGDRGTALASRRSLGALDLDDGGAEGGEQPAGERTRHGLGDPEDHYSFARAA